jgi:hypothetical protein
VGFIELLPALRCDNLCKQAVTLRRGKSEIHAGPMDILLSRFYAFSKTSLGKSGPSGS